jgi:UTP--glucose-1-phosphate uridylyltransferase
MPVDVAVIPAAGLGTRFLPYTKASPKEMLPIIDRPTIEYVVEEAVDAGIADVLVITARGKAAIEDHFDRTPELEEKLEADGRLDDLAALRRVSEMADIHFVRQGIPLGLGHAVAIARRHVGDRSFAVMLGDDIIHPDADVLRQMIDLHERTGSHVVCLMEVPPEDTCLYGCADVSEGDDGVLRIRHLVEKPPVEEAPSNLAVIGRYVLAPSIFDALDDLGPGSGGEIQLTDAIAEFAARGEVVGFVTDPGIRFDVGKKVDYLRTVVEFALERDDIGDEFAQYLTNLVKQRGLI